MDDRDAIRAALGQLTRRLRLARAVSAGSRFLVAGLVLAVPPLLVKSVFPVAAPWAVVGLVTGLAILGLLYGGLLRVRPGHAAGLADHHLGLKERMTCAVEHLATPDASEMAQAQLAETAARVRTLRPKDAFPLGLGSETRLVTPLAALVLALALLPPLPLHLPSADDAPSPPAADVAEEPKDRPLEPKLATPAPPKEVLPKTEEQDATRGPLAGHSQAGDQAAVFRDTKMSQQRPDFGSFVKQGDDRLKLLGRPEAIPDLQRDVTQSPYQVMIRRMQEQVKAGNLQGLSWEQIERLLSDLGQAEQRMGGGSEIADDLMQELESQGGRSTDKTMSALSRALNRLRDREEASRGKGKGLRDAPSRQAGAGDGEGGRNDDGAGGSAPGTEKSLQTRGDATQRIGGEKQDSTLDGDPREGPTEAYDTNLSGLGAQVPSRLPYLDVFSQYRKLMEETLTKEPIPFSYREQVKEYFKSLEPR
jgi:hypothetical protein